MRIAYMLTSLGIGGAEKQVIDIANRIAKRGHEVALIVLKSTAEHEWQTELPTYRLGMDKSVPGILCGLAGARRLLRSLKPDLLHSHTLPANLFARTLRAIGAAPQVLSTIHNIYEGGCHRTLAYRITDPLCIHTTAVSRAAANRYVQIKAVPQNKCSVLANGIDIDVFSPSIPRGRPTTPDFTWLAAGRDVPAKDFDNLLSAFQTVRSAAPNSQLWIAGIPGIHRSRDNGNQASGVRWLGLSEDMPRTLSKCDAFVLSSAWEGLPLVIGEAMALEKPIVATDVGGVNEIVGDTGMLVPPRNPGALAHAMLCTMRMSHSERCQVGKASRRRIVDHFNVNQKADQWESLYARILNDDSSQLGIT
jgi:glycosyltransferase involved in cell wall biosynthesis